MAEESKNSLVISKKNSGFPEWLDFDKLRREGIEYLGKLGGKVWTDHNVHDPGITILEMLCYALIDLGYRTNLPEADIFARNPEDKTTDNNFFTPSKILTCNPLTITDFRKLLVDIEEVKNAWLEIAMDQLDICRPPRQRDNNLNDECIEYLNGLYHVYIDLEKDPKKDFTDEASGKQYMATVEEKVRKALMQHRNLCEDFIDIYFLCKQEMGVCADIELEDNADPEMVYISMIEKLRDFFSPSPRYYTLQQLLDKGKPIEEIFAGRPYNIAESHGFVDTEEFEQLRLRKEIHLSDVYNVLFDVEGIRSVRQLSLRICRNGNAVSVDGWKFQITERHVPEFSMSCSGFQFTRNDMPVFIDFGKFDGLFQINFSHNGKILYQQPSPYLDSEIPKGVFRSDLGDYYSIQNEFPRVYGIAEGGLAETASAQRKSQAYQLKAWLLFFDQLLANYLSQLQHMRSLFALSAAENLEDRHTYFINQLTSVPDLQKLLRFNVTEANANSLGSEGSLLVFPVDKENLLTLQQQGKLETTDPGTLLPYTFSSKAEQDIAISLLKNDLYFDQYELAVVTRTDDCVYYFILSSSDDIALVSRKYFSDEKAAAENAGSVRYIGTFDENYRSYIAEGKFSFNLELNLLSFSKYLQLIVEDRELFILRRQGFLDHLLARFAEQFTAYAQLSFGFYNEQQLKIGEISKKEEFLTHYDELGSNRGRAYDYLENNWNNDNLSGFEKKVKAISGVDNWRRHSLCNFVVEKYEQQFSVGLKIAGTRYFSVQQDFASREEALSAAKSLFQSIPDTQKYSAVLVPYDNEYELMLNYAEGRKAVYPARFPTREAALGVATNLSGIFSKKDPAKATFESAYHYIPLLQDSTATIIRKSVDLFSSEQEAEAGFDKTVKKIDDRKKWAYDANGPAIGNLIRDPRRPDEFIYMNTDAFKIDISDTILGKPEKFTYEILDKENNFKFRSAREFDSSGQAKADAYALLSLLSERKNVELTTDPISGKVLIRVVVGKDVLALGTMEFNSQTEAEEFAGRITGIVMRHQYAMIIEKKPFRWKFRYDLGHEKNNHYSFISTEDYGSEAEAAMVFTKFSDVVPSVSLEDNGEELLLIPPKNKKDISRLAWTAAPGEGNLPRAKTAARKLLDAEQEIKKLSSDSTPESFRSSVDIDDVSKQGLYVYRLIDKDRVPAFYSLPFGETKTADEELKHVIKESSIYAGFLRVCMGGDMIVERRHPGTNVTWFRYQVKSISQLDASGNSLVLFESVARYPSKDEAETAFLENYLDIIGLASVDAGYGKQISLVEIPVEAGDLPQGSGPIVFIPKLTVESLGPAEAAVIAALVKLALSFPIRKVIFGSDEFNNLFPCDKWVKEEETDCRKNEVKHVYYFTYPSALAGSGKWQSSKYYWKPVEAQREFDFFMILLKYPGNYFVDCDHCEKDRDQYRIYIREVLAESTERFFTPEEAWGRGGVQKLICVSQSENAFHTYLHNDGCCFSFYIACNNGLVYHPCRYDSPKKRDDVMLKLYQGFSGWYKNKSWQPDDADGGLTLLDGSGKPFAIFSRNENDQRCGSDRIAEIVDALETGTVTDEGGSFTLKDDQGIILRSWKSVKTRDEWVDLLHGFTCFYPIAKSRDEKTGKETYCIEIKLPGFNACEDQADDKPCGCGNKYEDDNLDCYIAWKGRCCYETCAEAERALQVIIKLLINYSYYQPVFDCSCGPYGINIQFSEISAIRDQNLSYYQERMDISNWFNSEIIAVNPQCYPYAELACEAVGRAKKLINSEGLHLVEHILLRPRCFPEDCRCPQYSHQCDDETGCAFTWESTDGDPCTDEKDICFVPGSDPYSFIATIALPAWPGRFRKPENRKLLENLLYQEAPAHVLLRILWLSPHDFCCFESKYKGWIRWLAGKKTCTGDFVVCDFLAFLFDRNYECLDDCDVCQPCGDDQQQPTLCFNDATVRLLKDPFLAQVNDLFCWKDQECLEYEFIDCEKAVQVPVDDVILLRAAKKRGESRTEKIIPGRVSNEDLPQTVPVEKSSSKRKPQIVNARMNKYRSAVGEVLEKSKSNPIAAKAQIFLTDPQPEFDRLATLVEEIMKNKTPKQDGGKALAKTQIQKLSEAIICYYLDKICFNGKDPGRLDQMTRIFEKLRKAGMNIKSLFNYWDLSELLVHEPSLNEAQITTMFEGKRK